MKLAGPITPCLWFDTRAEEAVKFYCGIFENSRIRRVSHFSKAGKDIHGKDAGSVMTVEFEIAGQVFTALKGGPQFKFSEAISLQLYCQTQGEIDYFWEKLTAGGQEGPCGWLKDKFGLSWQVTPTALPAMLTDADVTKSERVINAFLEMTKFDLAKLKAAYAG
jgi:predicted 3-demethylubiquinone-9 3-methyltransferase (glyoxalase superfamily)